MEGVAGSGSGISQVMSLEASGLCIWPMGGYWRCHTWYSGCRLATSMGLMNLNYYESVSNVLCRMVLPYKDKINSQLMIINMDAIAVCHNKPNRACYQVLLQTVLWL